MDITVPVTEKFEIICAECRSLNTTVEVDEGILIVLCGDCENGYIQNINEES